MIKRHSSTESRRTNGRNVSPQNPARGEQEKSPRQNGNKSNSGSSFHVFARKTSEIVGNPWTFVIALLIIIGWAILGPVCGFSDTWQLVINTATTIVTFLMVFLIQNTQNRDAKAIHLKLDELIHAMKGARNKLIDLEECSDEELAEIQEQFKRIGKANQKQSAQNPREKE